jgi:hypothetical protein
MTKPRVCFNCGKTFSAEVLYVDSLYAPEPYAPTLVCFCSEKCKSEFEQMKKVKEKEAK